ncbi:MAG: hypothetical protein KHZ93_00020 [Clostridiales bacterium]|nr:hypothetical protein [Clostridiales bacterium]
MKQKKLHKKIGALFLAAAIVTVGSSQLVVNADALGTTDASLPAIEARVGNEVNPSDYFFEVKYIDQDGNHVGGGIITFDKTGPYSREGIDVPDGYVEVIPAHPGEDWLYPTALEFIDGQWIVTNPMVEVMVEKMAAVDIIFKDADGNILEDLSYTRFYASEGGGIETVTVPEGYEFVGENTYAVEITRDAHGHLVADPTQVTFVVKVVQGDGSESNPYRIRNAEDLKEFAKTVNDGELAACAELIADIDLNPGVTFHEDGSYQGGTPEQWTTIKDYNGIFNGNGKTIRGLYIDNESEYQGLFGENTGTIKNLGIIDSYVSAKKYVGSIVGRNGKGVVENCYNKGFVNGESNVGGIAGYTYGAVQNCYNTGNITSAGNTVGGVTGHSETSLKSCYNTGVITGGADTVGGVVGSSYGIVENCFNTGNVTGTGNYSWETNVGGVTGSCGSYSRACTVQNCYNTGNVSGGNSYTGGVSGDVSKRGEIVNCYNIGGIKSDAYAGGIVGENNNGTVKFCHSTGVAQGKIGEGLVAGKLFGTYTIENTYYLSDTETQDGGKTKEQFASGAVAFLLNENQPTMVWKQNIDNGEEKDNYPTLSGGDVYKVNQYSTCNKSDTPVEVYSNTDADILGAHRFGDWTTTKEPTCTKAGMKERTCTLCNHKETEELSPLGHHTELINVKEATCTEEGYTGDQVCSVCGEVVEKGSTVAKIAHDFQNGKCTVCGAPDPSDVPVDGNEGDTDNPNTGESSHLVLCMALLLLSGGTLTGILTALQRKKKMV